MPFKSAHELSAAEDAANFYDKMRKLMAATQKIKVKKGPKDVRRKINHRKDLPSLPREVIREIVKAAMVSSQNGELHLTLSGNAKFRPRVAVACLQLDRDLYHIARESLYSNNHFIFKNEGYEVRTIADSIGLYKCRLERCVFGSAPVLVNATFEVGCMHDAYRSEQRLKSFSATLKTMKRYLQVENLTIHLQNYAWRIPSQMTVFLQGLRKIQVSKSLTIKGLDVHLEFDIRAVAWLLGMEMQPVRSSVRFRGTEPNKLGGFEETWVKQASGTQPGRGENVMPTWELFEFNDASNAYSKWLETADEEAMLNGMDYVVCKGDEVMRQE